MFPFTLESILHIVPLRIEYSYETSKEHKEIKKNGISIQYEPLWKILMNTNEHE